MSLATIELYLLKDCALPEAFYVPECSRAVALVTQGGWDAHQGHIPNVGFLHSQTGW